MVGLRLAGLGPCEPVFTTVTDVWFLVHMLPPEIILVLRPSGRASGKPLEDQHPNVSWCVIIKCDMENNFSCSEVVSWVRRSPHEALCGC